MLILHLRENFMSEKHIFYNFQFKIFEWQNWQEYLLAQQLQKILFW